MTKAKLISITPNYEELLKCACSKPYGKDVSMKTIVDHIIAAGHLSILEHCYASFEIECSVAVLGQLTRHRHLSFTCQSARGSEFNEVVIPDKYIKEFFDEALRQYKTALDSGLSYEYARYLLPQGVKTHIVVTGNFRAWYEYLPKRLCQRAMPEHRELATLIQNELAKACPDIFSKVFMNCSNCKERSCKFK